MAPAALPLAAAASDGPDDLTNPTEAEGERPAAPVAPPAAAPVAASPASVAPAPVAAKPVRVEPYHLPTDELAALATSAGLQWVQSDADKIGAVQAAMAAEPAPVRVPREPRRHVLVDDGPLVLVETKKDLSQLKLPFEQQQPSA